MKNTIKKILSGILPVLFILITIVAFSSKAGAEEFRIERVCNNGVCIVTVYNPDGAIVNVYEELDSNP